MAGAPILAGVVGWPVAHSLSPLIHTIWSTRAGINGYYIPIAIPPSYDEFASAMDALKTIGFAGINVTLPHKENASRYADTASSHAQSIGAANMLTFNDRGAHAHNSDGPGFATALSGSVPEKLQLRVLILGAGGAARAVANQSRKLLGPKNKGPNEVLVVNRTKERAEEIATLANGRAVAWQDRSAALADIDLLVNTTSLGMRGQPPLEIDLSLLPKAAVVFDIVYSPLLTPLLCAARERGNPIVDGLDMLMWQAAPGFEAWFSTSLSTAHARVDEKLRSELVAELARREQA